MTAPDADAAGRSARAMAMPIPKASDGRTTEVRMRRQRMSVRRRQENGPVMRAERQGHGSVFQALGFVSESFSMVAQGSGSVPHSIRYLRNDGIGEWTRPAGSLYNAP